MDYVVYIAWKASPSYDICCMSAINDPLNNNIGLKEPRRRVYGIRILRRGGENEAFTPY